MRFLEPQSFELLREGTVLVALPPTLGFREPLGRADPFEWDHAPGSAVWFPLGDGIPAARPQLTIGGTWMYGSDDAAMVAASEIHRACRRADSVMFRGRQLADLRPDLPGTCRASHGTRYREVTYTLTLNLTEALDPETIAEAQLL